MGSKFGERLRSVRQRRNLTQAALAERLGTSSKWVSELEHKKGAPKVSTCQKLAKVLDVSPAWLAGWEK